MYSTDIYEACERKRTVIVNQTKNKKRLWSLSEENKIIVLAEMMSSEIRKKYDWKFAYWRKEPFNNFHGEKIQVYNNLAIFSC